MRVLNLRGCNGSGKSFVARALMGQAATYVPPRPMVAPWYVGESGVIVVGKYTSPCGGCDSVHSQQDVIDAIFLNVGLAPIFFEGVIISTIFSTWLKVSEGIRKLQERLGQRPEGLVWAYLDTPFDVCLERVYLRNGGKPIKEDQVKGKWDSMRTQAEKAENAGELVVWLDYRRADCLVKKLLS